MIILLSLIILLILLYYCSYKIKILDATPWDINSKPDIAKQIALEYELELRLKERTKISK